MADEERRLKLAEAFPWKLDPSRSSKNLISSIPISKWESHFSDLLYNKDYRDTVSVVNLPNICTSSLQALNTNFLLEEVIFCIYSLTKHKATGMDMIAVEYIRD
ncbi:hypothetical protein GJ496_011529 [Pomphorhynchus laevis]|nr:hypothetical protein GJ496_011529 [Pomphorhynchus laevis]